MPAQRPFIYAPPQTPLQMVYEDDDLIAIDKPAGLLSVMGRLPEHQDSAYLRVLQKYPQARVIHRLDMATSGLLVFAKHRDAGVAISKLFQARLVKKQYVACVEGQLRGEGCIDLPLLCNWNYRPQQKVDFKQGKPAQTRYQQIDYSARLQVSRIALTPITGRSHQLRVHLAAIGHPILGDQLYHPLPGNRLFNRMALHASFLEFAHPAHHQRLTLISPAPF